MKSFGWALLQYDGVLIKREYYEEGNTQKDDDVKAEVRLK